METLADLLFVMRPGESAELSPTRFKDFWARLIEARTLR
jgi:hypothetical protein